jgi:hypothetical protein
MIQDFESRCAVLEVHVTACLSEENGEIVLAEVRKEGYEVCACPLAVYV